MPIGALAELGSSVGQSLISLYNLYPTATIIAAPARGASDGGQDRRSVRIVEVVDEAHQ